MDHHLNRAWRGTYLLTAAAAAGFVVYGSLVPFNFHAPAGGVTATLTLVSPRVASRTDFVSNVLLFFPLPFCLIGALCAGHGPGRLATAAFSAPTLTAGLAWAVEWAQQFLPDRTPSWNDVIASLVASALALVMWAAAGPRLTRWADSVVRHRQPRTGLEAALIVYAVLVALLQLLPLDITIRPAELAEKYRNGRILVVPFASLRPFDLAAAREAVADLLRAIPFGLLGVIGWPTAGTRRRFLLAFLIGFAAIGAIEGVQFFVFSRVFDVTDLITGAAGVGIGVWLARGEWVRRPFDAGTFTSWARLAAFTWMLFLFAWHWYPFDFNLDPASFRTRVPELITVPFRAYYNANPFAALDDAAGKVMLAIPLGALLWLGWSHGANSNSGHSIRTSVLLIVAALCFLAIELGQTLLPARFPDISDVLIGVAGAAVGMGMMAYGFKLKPRDTGSG